MILAMILFLVGTTQAALGATDFTDIQSHWARNQIMTALEQGIMSGTGSGQFMPSRALTRAELAVALCNLFKLDYGDKKFFKAPAVTDYYDDVPDRTWYSNAVMLCAINNIFPGDSRKFEPQAPVTRAEAAQTVAHCFTAKKVPVVTIMMMPQYADTQNLDNQQMSDIAFVTNTGIMKGYNNFFRPQDAMTRAEAACVLLKTAEVLNRYSAQ
jgi:hypothetical protein